MKTTGLIFIYYTRGALRGTTGGGAGKWVCFGDIGRHTSGYACFITWSRPVGWSFF